MDCFDWLPFVTEKLPPREDKDDLVVRYQRGEFRLRRRAPLEDVYWLLGLYQAEGSKKAKLDWSFPSTNITLLAAAIEVLGRLGISTERLYLQVLHDPDDDPTAVRAAFETLGPRIASVRPRVQHKKWRYTGGRGAVLHVEKAAVFWRLTVTALARIFENRGTFPSREAARAFALGWLDGDGSVHLSGRKPGVLLLRLHGSVEETRVVLYALHSGFAWVVKGSKQRKITTDRSLTIHEAAALANDPQTFRFSMNRVRLLYGLLQTGRSLIRLHTRWAHDPFSWTAAQAAGINVANIIRQGLVHYTRSTKTCRLNATALRTCELIAQLAPEIETLRQLAPPERLGKTGVKCAPYPTSSS